jgi:hypothetical protein
LNIQKATKQKAQDGPCAFCFVAFWPVRARGSGLGTIGIGRSRGRTHFVHLCFLVNILSYP